MPVGLLAYQIMLAFRYARGRMRYNGGSFSKVWRLLFSIALPGHISYRLYHEGRVSLPLRIHGCGLLYGDSFTDRLRDSPEAVPVKNRLRVLRAERDWTQEDLARKLGISRQAVIAIEKEKYDPSLPLAFKIARLFKQQVESIFSYEDEAHQIPGLTPSSRDDISR